MYIPCLNGVRAFAIFLVLLAHLIRSGVPIEIQNILGYANLGTLGVRLFFLLSGFLITYLLDNELQKNGRIDLVKFFIRRLLRIFPAFYFYLIVLGILSCFKIIFIESSAILYAAFYIQNFNVFQNAKLFATSWLVEHSWSLSVEEQFYVIFPFSLSMLRAALLKKTLLTLLLVTSFCSFFRMVNYSFPEISRITGGVFFMHCDFLFYGGVIALYIETIRATWREFLYPMRYFLLALAFILSIYSSRLEYYSSVNILIFGNLILFSNSYILLFFLLFPNSVLGRFFENSIIQFIGMLSYSVYIWQQLFLGSSSDWMKYKFLTFFPYNIFMILICALFSYFFIEKPFLRIKTAYFGR